ncbi:MAG TPA: aminotransferase class III-fold pyridoxal phosphate-dependent enzyme, partial [Rhodocyclaceae bacterium]|nr:aminotransferase class III-fold pyridoxal phosphate-dependent enzyme [Rhodocyclaceae bacterium]
ARLQALDNPLIRSVRGRGLLIGLDLDPARCDGYGAALALLEAGILTRETRGSVIRLAPPLIIDAMELAWAQERIETVLARLASS